MANLFGSLGLIAGGAAALIHWAMDDRPRYIYYGSGSDDSYNDNYTNDNYMRHPEVERVWNEESSHTYETAVQATKQIHHAAHRAEIDRLAKAHEVLWQAFMSERERKGILTESIRSLASRNDALYRKTKQEHDPKRRTAIHEEIAGIKAKKMELVQQRDEAETRLQDLRRQMDHLEVSMRRLKGR